ncbi:MULTISPECIES: maleylpyruvate isomerase N-terminal domain-containing protein [Actinoalloteichus]|uniref:TIGR03083 family protein n=1 Tax=Actinoalloteichus caeruleus DSM 43889 TaxID=1120930 RepID=A0ABT1JHV1_ACTCY|nr:maleylpyruvate isomerase N-terminal domain-containing protein [Actinoalloteichus caeruleus]MCP2331847.1 TIGR03083 family protein [Actinoalloteichus caeruleus DSM 43889]
MTTAPLVDYENLFTTVGAEGAALVRALPAADPGGEVPGCPGRTLGDTARHVGRVHREVARCLRGAGGDGAAHPVPTRGPELAEYVHGGLAELMAVLATREPAEPCPTLWPADPRCGFWYRRMAHETTVHRVDVEAASLVDVGPVESPIAVDGIDEILFLYFGHRLAELAITASREAVVAVRAGGRTWHASAGARGSRVRRVGPGPGGAVDATVSGDPSSVLLWLWGRLPDRAVTVDGDFDAIAQLWALLRVCTR